MCEQCKKKGHLSSNCPQALLAVPTKKKRNSRIIDNKENNIQIVIQRKGRGGVKVKTKLMLKKSN